MATMRSTPASRLLKLLLQQNMAHHVHVARYQIHQLALPETQIIAATPRLFASSPALKGNVLRRFFAADGLQGSSKQAMEKGSEAVDKTGDKVGDMANKSKQYAQEKMDSATDMSGELKEKVKQTSSEVAESAKDTSHKVEETVKDKSQEAKEHGKGVVENVTETAQGLKDVGVEAAKSIKRDAEKIAEKAGLKSPN
ncbi:unnamed protein product [Sphagnum troendelagicum]|uniref:Late embryogenesis abundant protein n=1 Tax=Sphagnum troendelagicum TaxID=128251 RepID=A0ABP0UK56_9BRYO